MLEEKSHGSPYPYEDTDLFLLRDGAVALFYRHEVLEQVLRWLENKDYQLRIFDCSTWQMKLDFHYDMGQAFQFPDNYASTGGNLDAFNDLLRDVEVPDATGMVIVFLHYDAFAAKMPEYAHVVLDIFASASWNFLVDGRRLITLVQSDDPRIELPPLGCRNANLNRLERNYTVRGL